MFQKYITSHVIFQKHVASGVVLPNKWNISFHITKSCKTHAKKKCNILCHVTNLCNILCYGQNFFFL